MSTCKPGKLEVRVGDGQPGSCDRQKAQQTVLVPAAPPSLALQASPTGGSAPIVNIVTQHVCSVFAYGEVSTSGMLWCENASYTLPTHDLA